MFHMEIRLCVKRKKNHTLSVSLRRLIKNIIISAQAIAEHKYAYVEQAYFNKIANSKPKVKTELDFQFSRI
jgi:hypothetical protein